MVRKAFEDRRLTTNTYHTPYSQCVLQQVSAEVRVEILVTLILNYDGDVVVRCVERWPGCQRSFTVSNHPSLPTAIYLSSALQTAQQSPANVLRL